MSRSRFNAAFVSFCLLLAIISQHQTVSAQTPPEDNTPPTGRTYDFRERIENRKRAGAEVTPSTLALQAVNLSAADPGGNPWDILVFDHWTGTSFDLYYVDSDPTKTDPPSVKRITNTTDHEIEPAINPYLTRILFSCQPTGGNYYNLVVMNLDGTGRTVLTTTAADNYDAAWSPNGQKIAFTSERDGQPEIYVMNADGSGQKRLTNAAKFDGMPAWSPDGSKIAFISERSGIPTIWLMNADGTGLAQLNNRFSLNPVWSPDGTKIAFSSLTEVYDYWFDIYIFDLNNSTQRYLGSLGGYVDLVAQSWSPSGRYLNYIKEYYTIIDNKFYLDFTTPEALDMLDYDDRVSQETYYEYRPETVQTILTSLSNTILNFQWLSKDPILPQTSILPVPVISPTPIQYAWNAIEKGGSGLDYFQVRYKSLDTNVYNSWNSLYNDPISQTAALDARAGAMIKCQVRAVDKAGNVEPWKTVNSWTTTVESDQPVVQFEGMKPYLPQNNVPIRYSGYDPGGSGIDVYYVYYREEGSDYWSYATTTREPYYYFHPAKLGTNYYFKLGAVDKAGTTAYETELPFPISYYAWEAGGTLHSPYGAPVSGGEIQSNPAAMQTFPADKNGQYWVLGKEPENTSYSLAWNKPSYGRLPLTNIGALSVFNYDIFLPPQDNSIQNWGFESGQFTPQDDWTAGGQILPRPSWDKFHTGGYSASFGGLAQTTPIEQVTSTAAWPCCIASVIDQNGDVHMVWRENYQLFYARKAQGEGWSSPEAISPNTTNPNRWPQMPYLNVDALGTLHVMWEDTSNPVSVNHRSRTSAGMWSEQVNVAGVQTTGRFSYTVSSTGQVHVAWNCMNAGKKVICYNKMEGGVWGQAEVLPPTPNPSKYPQLTLDANDLPVIAWNDGVYPNADVLVSRQDAAGNWSTPSKANPAPLVTDGSENALLWLTAFNDGSVQVGYSTLPQQQPKQFMARTLSAGGSWAEPLVFEQTSDELYFLGAFPTPDGALHIAWHKRNSIDGSRVSYRQYQPAGGWLAAETIFDGHGDRLLTTRFTIGQDNIPSFFMSRYFSQSYFIARRGANAVWSKPVLIHDSSGGLNFISLLIDSSSNLYMTWYTSLESDHQIYYNERHVSTQSGVSTLSQTITIPEAVNNPGLSFLYLTWSSNVIPNLFTVTLDTGSGPQQIFDTTDTTFDWQHAWVDLSAWSGQTGTLAFNLLTEPGLASPWAFLDEVSLGSSFTDVWVDLQGSESMVLPGADINLEVHYGAYGPAADGVVVSLALPDGIEFVSASAEPAVSANKLVWDASTITPGSPAQSIQVKLRAPLQIAGLEPKQFTATITTPSTELETENNQAQVFVEVHWSTFMPVIRK